MALTDLFCDWAPRFTPHVLAVPTQSGMFWSSPVALVCAVNLMVNSVIKRLGTKVEARLETLTRLHQSLDRKSVVSGKSGSVRVYHEGRRIIKKKKKIK